MGLGWFLWVVLTLSRLALAVRDDRRVLQAAGEKGIFTDTQALMSFKQRIEKDPQGVLNGWNVQTSSNSCDWFGVTCATSRVVALNLTGCGLVAPLPTAALAPLDQLQDMRLSGNGFYGYGSDQEVASACNTLTSLDLSSNNLTGSFSNLFLQNCNTLTYLNISHNIFSGLFPPNVLGDGSSVRWLDLSHNNFSGILQSDLFAHCGALSWLDISANSLSGSLPSGVAKCSTLEHLDLSNNHLNGTLPADLFPTSATTSNLTFLGLSSNQFTGLLPDIASCGNLAYMDLSDNHFTGQIPSSIGACTSLRLLNISFNNLIGDLPASLASLGSLELLYLSDNNLTGTIPPEFGDSLVALQELDLSGNELVGTIPASLSNCTYLHYLNLGDNGLSGIFPEDVVSRMPSLQTLIMSFNNLTGSLPASLSNSSYLANLDLSANGLTGTIPDTLCGPVLRQLLVADNEFTGAVALGSCASLVTIDMSCNFLGGTLPASLPALPYLQELIMWGNLIGGEIPPNICSAASQLKKLILNVNLLTGTIPPTLANCSSLEWLTLTSNLLTGSIPPELGFMPRINMLQLGNNSLSGTIPTTFGNCKMLIWLDLSSNQLEGSIPTELANQSGKVIKGTLGGTNFAFLKFLQRPGCAGLGALLAFADIRTERLEEIPNFKRCNLTRLYLGIQPYYFPGPAGGSLQYLDLANNKLTGTIPEEIGTMVYLQVLSLSYNALTGTIPSSLENLVHVTIFHLDHNNLQGPIPPGLANLGLLNQLDLSSNNLSGTIPTSGTVSTFPPSDYADNPYLCGPPLLPCDAQAPDSAQGMSTSSSSGQWSGVSITMTALGTFVFVMACVCGLAACLLSNHQRMRRHLRDHYVENLPSSGSGSWNISSAGEPLSINVATFEKPLRKLTFAHLLEATKGFSSEAIVGRGGFGDVYKATLEDGTVVAIKKLIPLVGQGDREFMAEMETIGKIKHRNLVPLLGYCRVGEERLLVYEYMEGGSLDKRLHGNVLQNNNETLVEEGADEQMGLSWDMRKRVALGTARGLCFLHHSCIPHIIHRDLKSSNVLLDDALEARVSDFGMARLVSASETHLSVSSVVGTPGYVPPEYCHSFRCTTKGDVYSFGVVLLELITGRRPTWSSSAVWPPSNLTTTSDLDNKVVVVAPQQEHDEGGVDLVGWVKRHVRAGRERELLDEEALTSGMIATVDLEMRVVEMRRYLDIACWCVEERPWKRPNMLQVMALFRELHRDQDLDPSE